MLKGSPVHRLWRRLPRAARQEAYAWLTSLPLRPVAEARLACLPEPVTVVGALRAPTGLGQAARLALRALAEQGVATRAIDLSAALLQPISEAAPDAPAPEPGPGTLLVYLTPPNAGRALAAVPPAIRKGKVTVAGWVCETERLPALWARQARYFHVLTAPSRFAATAIANATGRPVAVIGHPVAVEQAALSQRLRRSDASLTIGAMFDVGSSAARKDVAGLAAVLQKLVEADKSIRIRIKARDLTADPVAASVLSRLVSSAPERVDLVGADHDRETALRFFGDIDMLLSLSRAEGFGLPYAEAVLAGVRVAAPHWGGATDFLDDSNSLALPYRLIPIDDPSKLYAPAMGAWADVEPGEAADLILGARADGRLHAVMPTEAPAALTAASFTRRLLSAADLDAPDLVAPGALTAG
jgi:hypothetical protein